MFLFLIIYEFRIFLLIAIKKDTTFTDDRCTVVPTPVYTNCTSSSNGKKTTCAENVVSNPTQTVKRSRWHSPFDFATSIRKSCNRCWPEMSKGHAEVNKIWLDRTQVCINVIILQYLFRTQSTIFIRELSLMNGHGLKLILLWSFFFHFIHEYLNMISKIGDIYKICV